MEKDQLQHQWLQLLSVLLGTRKSSWKHLLAEAGSLLWQYQLSVCAIPQEKSMKTSHISTTWNSTLAEKYQFFLGQKPCS
jgi:hypothetical protein